MIMAMVFLLLLSLNLWATSDSTNLFEKSFPRDNTYCTYQGKKLELLIRGGNKFSEPNDKGYGEYIFYQREKIKPNLLNISLSQEHTYRFLMGKGTLCSKSHGYKLDDNTLGVIVLKENQPFKDKLVILQFDLKTLTPKGVVDTNYSIELVQPVANGFSFNSFQENYNLEMGKLTIEGTEHIFQEIELPLWMDYTNNSFAINPELTFNNFPFKIYFKDLNDFLKMTAWNKNEKKFERVHPYISVNHKIKKKCLLFSDKKQKPTGQDPWRCQEI